MKYMTTNGMKSVRCPKKMTIWYWWMRGVEDGLEAESVQPLEKEMPVESHDNMLGANGDEFAIERYACMQLPDY